MLVIAEAGGHSPMHALAEAGGWHHLPGRVKLDGTSFIVEADSLHSKQNKNIPYKICILDLNWFAIYSG